MGIKIDINNLTPASGISRREFIKYTSIAGGTLLFGMHGGMAMSGVNKSQVSFIHRRGGSRGGPFEKSWIIKITITCELDMHLWNFTA